MCYKFFKSFRKRCFFNLLCIFCLVRLISNLYLIITSYKSIAKIDLSCYYLSENDALMSVEDPSYSPGVKAIFFHETSCRGGIDSRQACAVESAARLHPSWQINLLFSSPVTKQVLGNSSLTKLLQFKNVQLARVHIDQYCNGTIIGSIPQLLPQSTHPIEHASDILRILTLHKFGGIYLDTDAILIQNLDSLPPNWIAKQATGIDLATGAMAFSKDKNGANMTQAILMEINESYNPQTWSSNGPEAIEEVVKRWCPNALDTETPVYCAGVEILPPETFYPLHWGELKQYFENGSIDYSDGAYMHHMWNLMSRELKINRYSRYANLARKFCPSIYEMHGDRFGDNSSNTSDSAALYRSPPQLGLTDMLRRKLILSIYY